MKKLTLFLFSALFSMLMILGSCEKDESIVNIINYKKLPSTEVYIQGAYIGSEYITRRAGYGDRWPHVEAEWESARFSIRIDGTIPGYTNQSSTEYWGGFEGPNLGKVYAIYPYGRYDDRGFDYYQVDKATGMNTGLFRYVFDPTGVNTLNAIMEIPDMKVVLEYWRDKNRSQKEVNDLNAILAEWDNYNILWYVVKEVGSKNLWHVNGVLTDKDNIFDTTEGDDIQKDVDEYNFEPTITDPLSVPDNVEVDIHLQEHKDWNEIKTSIHIRTDAKDVIINIPIDYSNIVEQDDFAVRFYDYYYQEYEIEHEIIHDVNGITIKINNIDPDFINMLKRNFGDGLTVEVHSYAKQIEGIYEEIKQSTITTTNICDIKYSISSAYDPEDWILFPIEE